MPRRFRLPLAAALAVLASAAPAEAFVTPADQLPGACRVAGFGDRTGTDGAEVLVVAPGSERVFGYRGADWLVGSRTLPGCLFGGPGDDVLTLLGAGGAAFGEGGDDVVTGDAGPDALTGGGGADLLAGAGGTDVLRGGSGVDGLSGGDGDDVLDGADGRAEVLDCGAGRDTVIADRADVLLGCEAGTRRGAGLPRLQVRPRKGGPGETFKVRVRVPRDAGPAGYRILVSSPCSPGLREAGRFPADGRVVRRGEVALVGLVAPGGTWCRGRATGLVVRQPGCPAGDTCTVARPVEPVGRLKLRVR